MRMMIRGQHQLTHLRRFPAIHRQLIHRHHNQAINNLPKSTSSIQKPLSCVWGRLLYITNLLYRIHQPSLSSAKFTITPYLLHILSVCLPHMQKYIFMQCIVKGEDRGHENIS
jgi:hypothetical protein